MSIITSPVLSWLKNDIDFTKIPGLEKDEQEKLTNTINYLRSNIATLANGTIGSQSESRPVIRKIKANECDIPFDMDYHSVKGKIFICLGLLNLGKFKAVYKQIQLPSLEVEAVGKQELKTAEDIRLANNEIAMLTFCKKKMHLVQLHYAEIYESKKKGGTSIYKRVCHYYPMGDLRLCREILSPNEKFQVAIQLIQGLMTLHQMSIIHRDLKPANILLEKIADKDGKQEINAVIADLGLACREDDVDFKNCQCGTLMYMSPQCLNEEEANCKDDDWSIGVVLSELFFATAPTLQAQDTQDLKQIIKKLDTSENKQPSEDETLKFVIWSLLQVSPTARMILPKALNMLKSLQKQPQ